MTGARGESTLKGADGRDVCILLTNRACANAERALGGKAVLTIAQEISRGEPGMGDVAQLLLVGMEAARQETKSSGRAVTLNDAYALMDEVGLIQAVKAVAEAVSAVISYVTEEQQDTEVPKATADNPTA